MTRVLVIDDDRFMRETLSELLEDAGYQVVVAENGRRGMAEMRQHNADIVITDIIMPDKEGMETIVELRHDFPTVPVIAISGGSRKYGCSYLSTATPLGANAALQKPFQQADLLETVGRLLAARQPTADSQTESAHRDWGRGQGASLGARPDMKHS